MLFSSLPGYDEVKQVLLKVAGGDRMPHALLFTGAPGSPVVPLTLSTAQYLYCQDKQEADACGRCEACVKVERLIHPDLHLLFPVSGAEGESASDEPGTVRLLGSFRDYIRKEPYGTAGEWGAEYNAGNRQPLINVRDVRQLIGNLGLKSYEGGYKVAFIWLPELMNASGANALLKMLEEPPEKTVFLLATYEQDALLATILSRVIQVRVRPAEDEEIAQVLKEAGIAPSEAGQALLGAEGSIARALELARQEDAGYQDRFLVWMRSCFALNIPEMATQADEFAKMGREGQKWMVSYALSVFRRLLRHKMLPPATPDASPLARFFDAVPAQSIEPAATHLEHLYEGITRNAAPKLAYLSGSLKIGQALRAGR